MAQLNFPSSLPNFQEIADEISQSSFFQSIETSNRNEGVFLRLAELVVEKEFGEGEILIQERELCQAVWLFVEGRVSATKRSPTVFEGAAKVAVFEKNTSFGDTSLLEPNLSALTLTAESYGRLFILDEMAFTQFSKEYPEAALQVQTSVARSLMHQIKKAQEALRLLQTTIEILSA
ncbi:MAG: cyclic nucleotide-binding domain-containing protein [Proteobacteria bacterium]|nr:MAG: cyclic nucleotide-binding domain-containing protein [Pseudomonadota bacterium]